MNYATSKKAARRGRRDREKFPASGPAVRRGEHRAARSTPGDARRTGSSPSYRLNTESPLRRARKSSAPSSGDILTCMDRPARREKKLRILAYLGPHKGMNKRLRPRSCTGSSPRPSRFDRPQGMPANVVKTLEDALSKAVKNPDYIDDGTNANARHVHGPSNGDQAHPRDLSKNGKAYKALKAEEGQKKNRTL